MKTYRPAEDSIRAISDLKDSTRYLCSHVEEISERFFENDYILDYVESVNFDELNEKLHSMTEEADKLYQEFEDLISNLEMYGN